MFERKGSIMYGRKPRPPRKQTQRDAWVGVQGSFAMRHCTVLDISEGGAKLLLDDPGFTTSNFELKFARAGRGRPCRVAWRKGREIGATFL